MVPDGVVQVMTNPLGVHVYGTGPVTVMPVIVPGTNCAGRVIVANGFSASEGPLFPTVVMNGTVSPGANGVLGAVIVMAMSATTVTSTGAQAVLSLEPATASRTTDSTTPHVGGGVQPLPAQSASSAVAATTALRYVPAGVLGGADALNETVTL